MFYSVRSFCLPVLLTLFAACLSPAVESSAQTAPQLLPYTSRLLAGGGTTAAAAGSACKGPAGSAPSGNTSKDAYGNGCLATEIAITAPRAVAVDRNGVVFFADYTNGLIRRIDPSTGIVTAVAGGASASPAGSASCGGSDSNTSSDVLGDGCLGTSVKLGNPSGLAFSASGDLYFSDANLHDVRKIASTGGVITTTGVISLVVGNYAGTNASAQGYSGTCSVTDISTSTGCLLRAPYGIGFDSTGDLLITEQYYYAVMAVNTNVSGTNTVAGVPVAAGTMVKIAGSRASGAACTVGTASSSGCSFGTYTNGAAGTASELDNPYAVAADSNGNIFVNDEYYNATFQLNATTGILNHYAGKYTLSSTGAKQPATTRAAAGSFTMGSNYGLAIDPNNNVYISDALNGYVWRVDGSTQSMYVVAGGGASATTPGSACPGAPNFVAVDTFGDGCPATAATYSKATAANATFASTGIFGLSSDKNGNIYVADEANNLIREVASGTQFGNVGASQTSYVDIHFAAGDSPAASGAFTITMGASMFTIGTPTSVVNTDNTTDYVLPITATPAASGAFSGTLTVKSSQVPSGVSFPLNGIFVQSPTTRTVVTTSSPIGCTGTTYSTTSPATLTASLVANGPSAPTGTITFFANGNQIGTPQTVTNIGTTSAPVYGANLSYTFTNTGNYSVTATYTPTTGSYFTGSTSSAVPLTVTAPTFTAAATANQENSVTAGGTALYSFTLSQSVYSGTITFSCTGLPAGAACVFNPVSVSATGCSASNTVAMSITTKGVNTALQTAGIDTRGKWPLIGSCSGCLMIVLLGAARRRGSKLRFGQISMLLALLLASSGFLACGKSIQPGSPTPSGTSTVTVTATGSTVSTFPVMLKVN